MIKKINVGLIGFGVCAHYFNSFIQNKKCNIILVCDSNKKKVVLNDEIFI